MRIFLSNAMQKVNNDPVLENKIGNSKITNKCITKKTHEQLFQKCGHSAMQAGINFCTYEGYQKVRALMP